MSRWTPDELVHRWQSLADYSEERVRKLIEEAKDPAKAEQLVGLLQERCDDIRYGEGRAQLDFSPLASCVALGESGFVGAVDILFDVGSMESAPALETASTHALARLGAPALRRLMSLIDGSDDPFARSFGYTVLEAAIDVDEETRSTVIDFCVARANTEGRASENREWGCWPALCVCDALVALDPEQARPAIDWWLAQECDVPREDWNELLIEVDGYALGPRTRAWREPWPVRCRRLAKELQEESPHARKAPNAPKQRIEPKVGRNAPCPCGSGKKFKKCCLR